MSSHEALVGLMSAYLAARRAFPGHTGIAALSVHLWVGHGRQLSDLAKLLSTEGILLTVIAQEL